jgi:hypothetical protein
LVEDEKAWRMMESIMLFGEICESKYFKKTAIILFFNKSDLFDAKIQKTPITCFPDVVIPAGEKKKALEFIENQFLSQNKIKTRQVSHTNLQFVLNLLVDLYKSNMCHGYREHKNSI